MPVSRRDFLRYTSAAVAVNQLTETGTRHEARAEAGSIKVVVWDERQPAQKEAYENFLGNAIAGYLKEHSCFSVKSVALDDREQGLSSDVLGDCDVLIWWGHVRHAEITPETGRRIVERIKAGTLSLIALHSAHWSSPFVEAMNERTRLDAARRFRDGAGERFELCYVDPPSRYTLPKREAKLSPYASLRKFPDGLTKVAVQLPYCCFPAYRHDGKPSQVRVLKSDHPIVAGVPATFEIAQTEMYDEPFHVPEPDAVVLEERWPTGEWFRSGMVWTVGKGRVFYFRPGHETYPVYRQPLPLKIIENAARWMAPAAT